MQPAPVAWSEVARRLGSARNYWLCTTSQAGEPHAVPIWGALVLGDLYFFTEQTTAKAKNVARDPRVLVHLESGDEVTIVHGTLEQAGHAADRSDVTDAFRDKYRQPGDEAYLPSADRPFVLFRLIPRLGRLWTLSNYAGSQQRWSALAS